MSFPILRRPFQQRRVQFLLEGAENGYELRYLALCLSHGLIDQVSLTGKVLTGHKNNKKSASQKSIPSKGLAECSHSSAVFQLQ
jgi:hypothetical protein